MKNSYIDFIHVIEWHNRTTRRPSLITRPNILNQGLWTVSFLRYWRSIANNLLTQISDDHPYPVLNDGYIYPDIYLIYPYSTHTLRQRTIKPSNMQPNARIFLMEFDQICKRIEWFASERVSHCQKVWLVTWVVCSMPEVMWVCTK